MNKKLQNILDIIQQSEKLDTEQKNNLVKAVKDADKELEITAFKLERTEKVKKTTAILLEETIAELEQKRKAVEDQNRELEIEASLERVRAVAMGMNKPDDLLNICETSYKEFQNLGFGNLRNTIIHIFNDEKGFFTDYDYSDYNGEAITKVDYSADPVIEDYLKQIKSSKEAFVEIVIDSGKLKEWKEFREKIGDYHDTRLDKIDALYYYFYSIDEGTIGISNFQPFTEEQLNILKRFRNVFDLAYRRYTDIALAEAQVREAQIEAALEKVRSRAMAMHNSSDLSAASSIVFFELRKLGITPLRSGVVLLMKNSRLAHLYATTSSSESDELALIGSINISGHFCFDQQYDAWLKHENYFTTLTGKDLKSYYQVLYGQLPVPLPTEQKFKQEEYGYYLSFSEGMFYAWSDAPYSEKDISILNRFKAIIDLTFRRYLDLQKAEAQTRDAKIEAALEKVRARAMAMHSSEDLSAAINVFFKELKLLGLVPRRCGVAIINEFTHRAYNMLTTATSQGDSFEVTGEANLDSHPLLTNVLNNWKKQEEYFPVLNPEEMKEYYRILKPQVAVTDFKDDAQYGYYLPFKEGVFYVWTEKELKEEELLICRRFTSVIGLTYRRYLDLKEAEARAVESVKQASLDRVRAEISSMRTTEDLQQITPIIWRELKTLEVPFIRCGVFIIDEKQVSTRIYLTTPDGKSLGVLNLPSDANELTSNTVEHWRKKQVYKEHWNKKEFISWTKSIMELGQVENAETYPGSSTPPESLHLHFVPFTQGMLYVGDVSPLAEEKLDLVKTLAEAFSIAYARYEDFNRVESAYKELNDLSNELKIKNEELESENQRKAIELEEARELQLAMLPKQIPEHPGLDIKVYMQTATEVGGDYYDFSYRYDGSLNIAIGDATGHGMKAGTLVTMMKSLFIANSSNTNIEEFFNSSNTAIKNSNLKRMMAAFAMLNISDYKAKFINAAMPPLYYYNKNDSKIIEIKHFNLPLGAMSIGNYKTIEINLNKGDVLIMMSDGYPELHSMSDELFGYERAYFTIEKAAEKEPADIIKHFKEEADSWSGNKEPEDDITFVVIKIK